MLPTFVITHLHVYVNFRSLLTLKILKLVMQSRNTNPVLHELLILMRLVHNRQMDVINCSNLYNRLTNVDEGGLLYGVSGGSGGYAETVFRHAAKTLFGKEIEEPLEFRSVRNSDFREVTLEVTTDYLIA